MMTGERTFAALSASHARPELRSQNPLYEKAGSLTKTFEKERCPLIAAQREDLGKTEAERRKASIAREKRRASFMVKRQRAAPALRPSQALSKTVDRREFFKQMRRDHAQAQAQGAEHEY